MGLNVILILAGITLIFQIVLLFYIRKMKKRLKTESSNPILDKYNIHSTREAWKCLNDSSIPAEDKEEIEKFYKSQLGN